MYKFISRLPLVALACIFALSIVCIAPENAHAGYLDAGRGSTLVQGIIAIAASVGRFWNSLKKVFRGKAQ